MRVEDVESQTAVQQATARDHELFFWSFVVCGCVSHSSRGYQWRKSIYIYNHRSTDENLAAQERFRSMEEQQSGRLQLGQPGLEVEDPCIDSESWFR